MENQPTLSYPKLQEPTKVFCISHTNLCIAGMRLCITNTMTYLLYPNGCISQADLHTLNIGACIRNIEVCMPQTSLCFLHTKAYHSPAKLQTTFMKPCIRNTSLKMFVYKVIDYLIAIHTGSLYTHISDSYTNVYFPHI